MLAAHHPDRFQRPWTVQRVHPRVRKHRLSLRQYDLLPWRDGDNSPAHDTVRKTNLTISSASVSVIHMSGRGRIVSPNRSGQVYSLCLGLLEMIPQGTEPRSWSLLHMTGSMSIVYTHACVHIRTDSFSLSLSPTHTHNMYVLSTPALWRCSQLISTLIIDSEFNLKGRRTVSQGTLL